MLEYEIWNRLFAYGQGDSAAAGARSILETVTLPDLTPAVLSRALKPFPRPVRTLDGLHLASMAFLQGLGRSVELASYDAGLLAAAAALGIGAAGL